MADNKVKLDAETISNITNKEKELTGEATPVKDGPTAVAQKYYGATLNPEVVSEITKGENRVTNHGGPVASGPAALVQSMTNKAGQNKVAADAEGDATADGEAKTPTKRPSGKLDSSTISKITEAEKKITGADTPVEGGPTAQAQKHAGEPIGRQNLCDITEGEKKIADGNRVKGGPTATAQRELAKSRA